VNDRLRICYLLEDTALFGGVKIVLQQADLLARRGHAVTIASRGPRPAWFPLETEFRQVERFEPATLPEADVTVATFWTTIAAAAAVPSGQGVHYCQGFEGSQVHNVAEHPAILAAYATPIPAMVLAPQLGDLIRERFGRPSFLVPPPLEPMWRPRPRLGPHRPPRVLVVHPFENVWKGVRTALVAVRRLREGGVPCRLVRLSQWPLVAAERAVLEPDEFHYHLLPAEVARLMRGCDLLLAPSWETEGFGLPVLEAMACGVPVVASDIAAFRFFAASAARLVPFDDVGAFVDQARAIVSSRSTWRGMRRAGLAAVRPFAAEQIAATAEEAMRWVASGRWRTELAGRAALGGGATGRGA
jgi:glycosyltransferase involved in cell wall biosynthesis